MNAATRAGRGWREPIRCMMLPCTMTAGGPLEGKVGSVKRQDANARAVLYLRVFLRKSLAASDPLVKSSCMRALGGSRKVNLIFPPLQQVVYFLVFLT